MNFIKQEHKHGCGIACIAMATGKNYDEILQLIPKTITDFNKKGITPECIQSVLSKIDYRNELRYNTILHNQEKRADMRYNFADILIMQVENHFVISIGNWVYDPALGFSEGYGIEEIQEKNIISVVGVWLSLPSDEDFEEALDKEAFRVPYDGSNNFYDEPTIKHWKKCWEWIKAYTAI